MVFVQLGNGSAKLEGIDLGFFNPRAPVLGSRKGSIANKDMKDDHPTSVVIKVVYSDQGL